MNITFKIGALIDKKKPREVYTIKVKYMHGDADIYTDEVFTFEKNGNGTQQERLTQAVAVLRAMMYDEYCDLSWRAQEQYLLDKLPDTKNASCWHESFRMGDRTCDSSRDAAIDGFEVRYFDLTSQECSVDVFVDGKKV
jgi:hypothetical protein